MMLEMLAPTPETRLQQGDIICNVDLPEYHAVVGDEALLSVVRFPFAVVLTQDCDLQQNHLALGAKPGGSPLVSTLVAPAYHVADAQAGTQLEALGVTMPSLPKKNPNSQSAKDLYQNKNARYHCLPLSQADSALPDLIVDFKHYFTVNSAYLTVMKERCQLASLNSLYREDLCQRFAAYLSRIGLPQQISGL